MDENKMAKLSKMMSYVLRHGAQKHNLTLGADGYIPVSELLGLEDFKNCQITLNNIRNVVADNDKQRFELTERNDQLLIRAVQGHSIATIDSEQLLHRMTKVDLESIAVIVHGTSRKAWDCIKNQGLSRMGRNHIHFAKGYPSDIFVSGVRSSSQVFVELDAAAALADGITLYESKNGIILSPGINGIIPVKYFKAVYDSSGKSLL